MVEGVRGWELDEGGTAVEETRGERKSREADGGYLGLAVRTAHPPELDNHEFQVANATEVSIYGGKSEERWTVSRQVSSHHSSPT